MKINLNPEREFGWTTYKGRQVFKIDIGHLPPDKADRLIKKLKEKFGNK